MGLCRVRVATNLSRRATVRLARKRRGLGSSSDSETRFGDGRFSATASGCLFDIHACSRPRAPCISPQAPVPTAGFPLLRREERLLDDRWLRRRAPAGDTVPHGIACRSDARSRPALCARRPAASFCRCWGVGLRILASVSSSSCPSNYAPPRRSSASISSRWRAASAAP
jgi:hypothetical protein